MKERNAAAGIAYGLTAYGMWGFFPLFFKHLSHVAPMAILCNRVAWGCVFVAMLLSARGQWRNVRAAIRRPRHLLLLAAAGVLLGCNWLIFLWAVSNHQVLASSLGYFLTPLINVLLAMLVLKERLNRMEWLSVALAILAVGNEFASLGAIPWISLALAGTFGLYGLIRKQVPIDAVSGLWLETLAILPVAGLYAGWQAAQGQSVFTGFDTPTQVLLAVAGVLTALPLMAFGAATQRLPLITVGMLMYINPTLQFLTAVKLFGEPMPAGRLFTFGLIWLGLLIYSWSAWRKYRSAA